MKATVNVDIDPEHARTMLRIAGFNVDVDGKTEKEVCEMAVKMNDCYGVETESIVWEDEEELER